MDLRSNSRTHKESDVKGKMDSTVIGKPLQRHDAWDKVFGRTAYASDFTMPDMLIGKVLRSPCPSADILNIDISEAIRLKEVKAILTADDVPNNENIVGFIKEGTGGEAVHRVLADKRVKYEGEPVALVAAEDEDAAEKALELIKVEYRPTPGVFDPVEAMKKGAPEVEEGYSNVLTHYEVEKGDVEKGFLEADVVVEHSYSVPFVDHAFIEPEVGVGWMNENGTIHLRVPTQVIENYAEVAHVMGIPEEKVRIIGTYIGGAFGGKMDITVENFLALLVQKTKRPVKMTLSREESFVAHGKRHPYKMQYKTGAKKDGTLVALKVELISDAGAYAYSSPWVLLLSMVTAAGPYRIPNVRIDGYTVSTNNIYTTANRGFGAPQVCFAYESQMDELAKELKMDPVNFRKMNYLKEGEGLPTGRLFDKHIAVTETAEKALDKLGKKTVEENPVRIGRGVASSMSPYGRMLFRKDVARTHISIREDGSVFIRSGIEDLGGGHAASLCQIASEVLGVPVEKIGIQISDSAETPIAGWATATRQMYMCGNATLKAAGELKRRLLEVAGETLGTDPDTLKMWDGSVFVKEDPEKSIGLDRLIDICRSRHVQLESLGVFSGLVRETSQFARVTGQIYPDYTFGSQAAEVAVNVETGEVRVLKLASCFDVGKAINPLSVEGQMEGGAVYGMGYGLTEDLKIEEGILKTRSFSEYLLPTSLDTPDIETAMIESAAGLGPYGAKGIGEPATISTAPAIGNAICDAIGIRIYDLPITPEKILRAIKSKNKNQAV